MACTKNSASQPNPVGTLALPLQISKRYLGTDLDVARRASGRTCVAGRSASALTDRTSSSPSRASQRRMNSSRWYLSRRATKIAAEFGCRPDTLRERLVNALGRRYRKQTCPTQAPSTQEAGAFLLNRGRGGLGKGGHEHSLHLPRCRAAAEAAEAAAPEATEAATAAPRRIAHAVALRGDGPSRRGHR